MTGHDDFDRTLAGWFEADALSPAPAGDLDRVLDATRRRRPRPSWLAGPGSHWVRGAHVGGAGVRTLPGVRLQWSTALILLLAVVALVAGAILVGALLLQPSPLPSDRLGHLAYGLDGDIYVADLDGRNPVRIANGSPGGGPDSCGSFWGEGPMWSPNGRHLAYRSCGTVFIADPKGHVVASFPGTGWRVSWSPDSTRVATWVETLQTIGTYGLDGARQALLNLPPGRSPGRDYDPAWSPDGASLLIPLGPPTPTQTPSQVWDLPLDDRPPRQLPADDPRSRWLVAYSPDGARLAFVEERKLPQPFILTGEALVVAANDGSQDRVLVPSGVSGGPANYAMWSPTGERIAFLWTGYVTQLAAFGYELRVVDVASATVTTLASSGGALGLIKFSPDGDRILYSRESGTTVVTLSLWSVRADGSDAQQLEAGTGWGDWQPLPAGP